LRLSSGVLLLHFQSGAGAEARKTYGWTVFGGMLAATSLAIFVVPVLFVLITKIAYGKKLKRLQEEHMKEEQIDQALF
jgi:HAE1 family hydrophobic/amphiphilic exporter-1